MCTATLWREGRRFIATMNRDESLMRGPETPPRFHEARPGAARWLGPGDADSGGTWMGVNEAGVAAFLLNRYLEGDAPGARGRQSRGSIVPAVLELGAAEQGLDFLRSGFDPAPYASFTLVLSSEAGAHAFAWGGGGGLEETRLPEPWAMIASSSWKREEVLAWRAEEFSAWRAQGGSELPSGLPSFHALQPEGRAEWAPLMKRSYACTRSITQARVDAAAGRAEMRYWPDPAAAARGGAPQIAALELTARAAEN